MNTSKNLPPRPEPPADLTDNEAVANYKAALRAWDRDVIAQNLLTATEVNALNSIFPPRARKSAFKILDFENALLGQR